MHIIANMSSYQGALWGWGVSLRLSLLVVFFENVMESPKILDYRKHAGSSVLKEVITSPLSLSLTTLTALSKRFGWVSWLVYPFFEIVSFLPYFDHRARKGCHNRGEFFCHVRVVLSSHIDIVQLWRTSLLDLGAFACVWRRLTSFISP